MTASVGSSTFGSGTSSTRTSRLPCQVTAFMGCLLQSAGSYLSRRNYPRRSGPNHRGGAAASVSAVTAAQELDPVRQGIGDGGAGLIDAPRTAREVHDQRPAPDAR